MTTCRIDLATAYVVTAIFGLAMVVIGSGLGPMTGGGATLIVDVAQRLEEAYEISSFRPPDDRHLSPLPEIKRPVFVADFSKRAGAALLDGTSVTGRLQAGAKVADGLLGLGSGGFASFGHLPQFDLARAFSVECRVRIDRDSQMPVVLSCGQFGGTGWFLQRFGGGWRWHLGGASCDGGRGATGRWVHLVGTFNGSRACLYQDGKLVASVDCSPNRAGWSGPLIIGQYSSQAPQYQVTGRIAAVKIYHRALKPEEIGSPKPE